MRGRTAAVLASSVAVIVLAVWQAAAVAAFGSLGRVPSVARAMSSGWPFAAAAASGLDRFAPVRGELAHAAFERGDVARAAELLDGLPPTDDVADLRARIALARNDLATAIARFADAGDAARARAVIVAVAVHDPRGALALATAFERDLIRLDDAPAVIAEAAWRAGTLAARLGDVGHTARAEVERRNARAFYNVAVRYDPTQETYLLSAGFEALALGDVSAARSFYGRAHAIAPDGIDALVGLALSSAILGDCPTARIALVHAQELAPRQHRDPDPAAAGFDRKSRAALARC